MLITLLTDFGDSEYVGAMRGVIRSLNPDVEIVDISHGIRRQSVRHAAYALLAAAPFFPFAVHVAVVDPGVGTARRAIAIACEGAYFVGPDNGILVPAARRLGIKEARVLENKALFLPKVSRTFHGRDVFAPAAAALASGVKFAEVGPVVTDLVDLDFGTAAETPAGLRAQVICFDPFGNGITNVPEELFAKHHPPGTRLELHFRGHNHLVRAVNTYGDGEVGELLALPSSGGLVEIAVNRGDASDRLGLREADELLLRPLR